jgi:hypothetical protein
MNELERNGALVVRQLRAPDRPAMVMILAPVLGLMMWVGLITLFM